MLGLWRYSSVHSGEGRKYSVHFYSYCLCMYFMYGFGSLCVLAINITIKRLKVTFSNVTALFVILFAASGQHYCVVAVGSRLLETDMAEMLLRHLSLSDPDSAVCMGQ